MTEANDTERRLELEALMHQVNAESFERIAADLQAKVERLAALRAASAAAARARAEDARARLAAFRHAAE